jgi:hypothetical protein
LDRRELRNVRDGALVGPVLELKVLQGQIVVDRLDIVGEDVSVIHLEVSGKPGLVGTESAGYLREEGTVDAPDSVSQSSISSIRECFFLPAPGRRKKNGERVVAV